MFKVLSEFIKARANTLLYTRVNVAACRDAAILELVRLSMLMGAGVDADECRC